jgi:hypothetical protein
MKRQTETVGPAGAGPALRQTAKGAGIAGWKPALQQLAVILPILPILPILSASAVAVSSAQETLTVETPEQRDARMKWWREARFGMFIHWGLYAVPAGTWKGERIASASGS